MTTIKSAYDRVRDHEPLLFLDADGECLPTLTKQSFKHECDINHIVKKYDKTGIITHVNKAIAQYGDFTQENEYQEALDLIKTSNHNFMQIPSEIRGRFDNNAGKFLEFATNPDNLDEMVNLGLAVKPSPIVETVQKVEIIETKPLSEDSTSE